MEKKFLINFDIYVGYKKKLTPIFYHIKFSRNRNKLILLSIFTVICYRRTCFFNPIRIRITIDFFFINSITITITLNKMVIYNQYGSIKTFLFYFRFFLTFFARRNEFIWNEHKIMKEKSSKNILYNTLRYSENNVTVMETWRDVTLAWRYRYRDVT